ncbi:MAG: FAD-dependent thymidylate synthase [Thermoproteus sp.]|nr:FAD-dependent thymidylate synthase [Thermoproteus sp.]
MAVKSPSVYLLYAWGSEQLIASLMDVLYRGAPPGSSVDEETVKKRIEALWRRGHWSTLEFTGFGVLVECSRACHTQFIRHRMASYWAESQRYVDYRRQPVRLIVPSNFPAEVLEESIKLYLQLREEGQRPEWARLVLPNAVAVRFAVQMNAREFFTNFAPLRCSASAQAEIRHVCWQMYAIAWRLWPTLAKLAWEDLPSLHRDFCTKVPKGEDCRLYAIQDAETLFGSLSDKPWTGQHEH